MYRLFRDATRYMNGTHVKVYVIQIKFCVVEYLYMCFVNFTCYLLFCFITGLRNGPVFAGWRLSSLSYITLLAGGLARHVVTLPAGWAHGRSSHRRPAERVCGWAANTARQSSCVMSHIYCMKLICFMIYIFTLMLLSALQLLSFGLSACNLSEQPWLSSSIDASHPGKLDVIFYETCVLMRPVWQNKFYQICSIIPSIYPHYSLLWT